LNVADARPLVEKLCSALTHPEGETAVRAAWILGERRESEAVADLIRAVETAADSFVNGSAVEALGKIADPRAIGCLEAAAKQGTVRVRIAALNALHLLREPRGRRIPCVKSVPEFDVFRSLGLNFERKAHSPSC